MSFVGEIKRRKVFQVAAAYAVVAWLLVQVITSIEAPLGLPDWFDTAVIVSLAIGFPIAVILAWAFDLTPQGLTAASSAPTGDATVQPTALRLALRSSQTKRRLPSIREAIADAESDKHSANCSDASLIAAPENDAGTA